VHLLLMFYGWPNGMVWSNVLAEPLIVGGTVAVAWPFRHSLMQRWTAFQHAHKMLHLAKLQNEPRTTEESDPGKH
jgi:hypothetical protein